MNVYLVYGRYDYEWQLDSIFSSREAAESCIKASVEHGLMSNEDFDIEEYEVCD